MVRDSFCAGAASADKHSTTCSFKSLPQSCRLETSTAASEEEDLVIRRQVEEDSRVFGSRQEPGEGIKADDPNLASNGPFVPSPTEACESNTTGDSEIPNGSMHRKSLPSVDWNAGSSPLFAWLNQSAIPFSEPTTLEDYDQDLAPENRLLEREFKEIEVFRNVRVSTKSEPEIEDMHNVFGQNLPS